MVCSWVLVVVCGEGAGGAVLVGGLVVPYYGGVGEYALEDACCYSCGGASAVAFESELVFEGVEY